MSKDIIFKTIFAEDYAEYFRAQAKIIEDQVSLQFLAQKDTSLDKFSIY